MTQPDKVLLGVYLKLVLDAYRSGRWDDGIAQAEIGYVISIAASQDPRFMTRVREAIDMLKAGRPHRQKLH
jgi:hypothetical protein